LVGAAALALVGGPAWADSVRDRSWQLGALKVAEAHRLSQGAGMTVAVIDTGVDANHPDLKGNVLPGIDAYDTDNPAGGTQPRGGHGTAVASLIAGHGHGPGGRDGVLGIAPMAKILPINVMNPDGRTLRPELIGIAMEHAVQKGANVVVIALNGSFDQNQVEAVQAGANRGAVIVASAGNSADSPVMTAPASTKGVVAVSAVDRKGAFSSTSVTDPEMDLAAPGIDLPVAQPGGGYATLSGTSIAAALAGGAAALIRATHPQDDWDLLLQRLLWTTADRGPKGRDPEYGWGALDLVSALTKEPEYANGTQPSPGASTPVESSRGTGLADGDDAPVKIDWLAGLYSLIAVAVPVALIVWIVLRVRRRRSGGVGVSGAGVVGEAPEDDAQWRRPAGTASDSSASDSSTSGSSTSGSSTSGPPGGGAQAGE
jgi:type VII secretion-associated serine protease mycosin